jgi:hypothetical protein
MDLKVGDVVPAGILEGEESDGDPAGLGTAYRLVGIGPVPMRDVYPPEELTEFCRATDWCWGARIVETPSRDAAAE